MRIGTAKQKRFKTLLQVGGMNSDVTEWLEHDSSILDSWKALRSEQRMFLYAVIVAIDIFVTHFSLLDLKEVKSKRDQAFIVGWRQLDFLFTNMCDLLHKREIINPERFLNSKTTMERYANIKDEDQIHAEFEALYRRTLQDEGLSDECKKGLQDAINLHKQPKRKKWTVQR